MASERKRDLVVGVVVTAQVEITLSDRWSVGETFESVERSAVRSAIAALDNRLSRTDMSQHRMRVMASPTVRAVTSDTSRAIETTSQKSEHDTGLVARYEVTRLDGSSEPGGKHEGCLYHVLDLMHDKFSVAALEGYADACLEEFPLLARHIYETAEVARRRFRMPPRGVSRQHEGDPGFVPTDDEEEEPSAGDASIEGQD